MPLASIASLAARIRSTASVNSKSGSDGIAGGILDRESGDSSGCSEGDVGGDIGWRCGEAPFEIGVDGHVDRCRDRAELGQGFVKRDMIVGPSERPGKPGTGGRERGKAELGEQTGAADVPRNSSANLWRRPTVGPELARVIGTEITVR